MRRVLSTELGERLYRTTLTDGRADVRAHQTQPRDEPLSPTRKVGRAHGMAPDHGHPQPHQAPQPHPGGRHAVNRGPQGPAFTEINPLAAAHAHWRLSATASTNCDSPARLPARSRIVRDAGATFNTASVSGTEASDAYAEVVRVKTGAATPLTASAKEMRRLHLLNSVQKLVNSGLLPGALAAENRVVSRDCVRPSIPDRTTENRGVPGSSPGLATFFLPA